MSRSSRFWCITDHSCSLIEAFEAGEVNRAEIDYFIGQYETCPTSQKKHIQAYVILTKKTTMKEVKKILKNDKAHYAISVRSPAEVRAETMLRPCCAMLRFRASAQHLCYDCIPFLYPYAE